MTTGRPNPRNRDASGASLATARHGGEESRTVETGVGQHLGHPTSGVDESHQENFAIDTEERWVFLEFTDRSGAYGWLEEALDLPITSAVADLLANGTTP